MRSRLAAVLLLAVLPRLSASAAEAVAPWPADVLVVVDGAPPERELPAWSAALARVRPGTPPLSSAQLPPMAGRLVGAPRLDGVDLAQPWHLALLRSTIARRPVLIVAVRDRRALAASAQAAALTVKPVGRYALVGEAAAVTALAPWAAARIAAVPSAGVRAIVDMSAIRSTFGAQLRAAASAAPAPGDEDAAAPAKRAVAAMLSLLEATDRLTVELSSGTDGVLLALALDATPDGAIDRFVAAQRPGDFGLLAKLPAGAAGMLVAGAVAQAGLDDALFDLFAAGKPRSESLRQSWKAQCALMAGEMAMSASIGIDLGLFDGLFTVSDMQQAVAIEAHAGELNELMAPTMNMKMTHTLLPPAHLDGLTLSRQRIVSDFAIGRPPKPQQRVSELTWTAFDGLLALHTAPPGGAGMAPLVDSARHGKGALVLDTATMASLDQARARHDSLWLRLDAAALLKSLGLTVPPLFPTMTLGFDPHRLRLRVTL